MQISVPLNMLFCHTKIYINEIGLYASLPGSNAVPLTESSGNDSLERYQTLIRCLNATREYLDRFLMISPDYIVHASNSEFLNLIYAVLVLGSISTGSYLSQLDPTHIRVMADFESYITALSHKTIQAIATTCQSDITHGHLKNLDHFWQRSKRWYEQSIMIIKAGCRPIGNRKFSFMDIISTVIKRCSTSYFVHDGDSGHISPCC